MKLLSYQDTHVISGGHIHGIPTPACLAGPQACVALTGATVAVAYFGWEAVGPAVASAVIMGSSAFFLYATLYPESFDHTDSHSE